MATLTPPTMPRPLSRHHPCGTLSAPAALFGLPAFLLDLTTLVRGVGWDDPAELNACDP
jgi:hypothetical protein